MSYNDQMRHEIVGLSSNVPGGDLIRHYVPSVMTSACQPNRIVTVSIFSSLSPPTTNIPHS